jgi:hypothetical protein
MVGEQLGQECEQYVLLELDVHESWPSDVLSAVNEVIQERSDFDGAEYSDEISLGPSEIELIDQSLGDTSLALYHATRLLPHEVESIRDRGLLPLTPELVNYRLDSAVSAGGIDSALAERLRPHALDYAVRPERSRRVCFSGSRRSLQERSAFRRIFTYWGGEAIFWELDDRLPDPALAQLSRIGTAAVVIAALPPRGPRLGRGVRDPRLAQRLVAVRLGLDPGLETHVDLARPDEIVDVVLQGSPEWNGLAPMSRS